MERIPAQRVEHERTTHSHERRGFLERAGAAAIGMLVALVPGAAGLVVLLDPLRRRPAGDGLVRVAALEQVPADGIPRRFPILALRQDAWSRLRDHPVGAVYLRREPNSSAVEALNAVCPHAGCFVNYLEAAGSFRCPCHDSRFEPGGARIDPGRCPSPRDLDSLAAEIREQRDDEGRPRPGPDGEPRREVWVRFVNFRAGTPEKVAMG